MSVGQQIGADILTGPIRLKMNLLQNDNYFGKTEYDNDADSDGIWGIWDEEFFQYSVETMSTFKEPFLSTIFSVSSHHPFKVPKKYDGKFPEGTLKMHQVIGYTDYAMQRFFEAAAKTDWYQNTIFVITADHTNQTDHRQYQTSLGRHAVPIIFFDRCCFPASSTRKWYHTYIPGSRPGHHDP